MSYQSQTGSQTHASVDSGFLEMIRGKREQAMVIVGGIMEDLMAFCPCCFVLNGSKINKGHGYFSDCRKFLGIKEYIRSLGWRKLKKQVILPYGHCWKCGLPNYGYNLAYHANGHDKGVPCPFSDYIGLSYWRVHTDRQLWIVFCSQYGLDTEMSKDEWVEWLKDDEGALFYHGLEVFLWLCKYYGIKVDLE